MHVDRRWIVVDSCLNPNDRQPAAISYLNSLDVNLEEDVCLVLITHWDDDHIAGIDAVVKACTSADVACSMALTNKEVLSFVERQISSAASRSGSGLDTLRSVLSLCADTGRFIWAKANVPLYPRSPFGAAVAVALSPSDDAVSRSIESLLQRAREDITATPRRYQAPATANGASVAASVIAHDTAILLGADLINAPNPLDGWTAVLSYARPHTLASVFKIPHHASVGAHILTFGQTSSLEMRSRLLPPGRSSTAISRRKMTLRGWVGSHLAFS